MAGLKAFALAVLLIFSAHAQEIAIDLLALQQPDFPVSETRVLLPDHVTIGVLDWTFGTSLRPIKNLLVTGKVEKLRVHIFNGPGLTNHQLGRYEPTFGMTSNSFRMLWEHGGGPKLRKHLIARTKLFCALSVPELEISPTLEHHLSRKAFKRQASLVHKYCPRAVIVSSTGFHVRAIPGFKPEFHGVNAPVTSAPCNASLDGDSAMEVDVLKWLERQEACTRYIWAPPLNCRLPSSPFIDPRKRTNCPSKFQLQELFELLKPLAPASCSDVPGCIGKLSMVEAPMLWKPQADDHGIDDPRANRPLWLSPFMFSKVRVLACNGQEVAYLGFYGLFDGGGYRYYSGQFGSGLHAIEMARRAEELSGSPSVVVQEGTRCFGAFHPITRQGVYR